MLLARDPVPHAAVPHRRLSVADCFSMLPDLIMMRRLQVMVRRSLVLCRRQKVRGILTAVIRRGLTMLLAHGSMLCRSVRTATCVAPVLRFAAF